MAATEGRHDALSGGDGLNDTCDGGPGLNDYVNGGMLAGCETQIGFP